MKTENKHADSAPRLARAMPFLLIMSGIIGFICSFVLTVDKFNLLANPNFRPNCNLNPVISCGSVMSSAQGSAFGFPNPFLGLAAFAIVGTVGVGMLAGAKYKHWFWLALNGGLLFALGFVHWLFYESVYRINSICPYCALVWITVITTFWYVTIYNTREGHLPIPRHLVGVADFARRHHFEILLVWILIIAILTLKHFWYYYGKFI